MTKTRSIALLLALAPVVPAQDPAPACGHDAGQAPAAQAPAEPGPIVPPGGILDATSLRAVLELIGAKVETRFDSLDEDRDLFAGLGFQLLPAKDAIYDVMLEETHTLGILVRRSRCRSFEVGLTSTRRFRRRPCAT
jgi:hypothetical protein